MAICNPDGTPYNTRGDFSLFRPEGREQALFNSWDAEIIRYGGSPINYFEVFIQIGTIDEIYLEDRGKIWSDSPIQLFATYEPIPSQNQLTAFGIDSPDEMIFDLNYKATLDAIGHAPKIGSRINTPHLNEDWVVVKRSTGEYKLWGVIRLQLLCERFQESATTGEGKISQSQPEFQIQ